MSVALKISKRKGWAEGPTIERVRKLLEQQGFNSVSLTRNKTNDPKEVHFWEGTARIPDGVMKHSTVTIHGLSKLSDCANGLVVAWIGGVAKISASKQSGIDKSKKTSFRIITHEPAI